MLELDPLLRSQAERKGCGGADPDDIHQDLRLSAFHSIRKCKERKTLLLYVELCVTYQAAKSAARERWDERLVPLEIEAEGETEATQIEIRDEWAEEQVTLLEYGMILRDILTEEEYRILKCSLDGCTYAEIAEKEKITRQTASNRMKGIGKKLWPHLQAFLRRQ